MYFLFIYLDWTLKHKVQNYLFISISFLSNIVFKNDSCDMGLKWSLVCEVAIFYPGTHHPLHVLKISV